MARILVAQFDDFASAEAAAAELKALAIGKAVLNFAGRFPAHRFICREAGAAAMSHYGLTEWVAKADASPVTAADHASNELITAALRSAFPDDAILSEESADSAERLGARRVWIVDPLDGTKEFLAQNGEFGAYVGLLLPQA